MAQTRNHGAHIQLQGLMIGIHVLRLFVYLLLDSPLSIYFFLCFCCSPPVSTPTPFPFLPFPLSACQFVPCPSDLRQLCRTVSRISAPSLLKSTPNPSYQKQRNIPGGASSAAATRFRFILDASSSVATPTPPRLLSPPLENDAAAMARSSAAASAS